MRIVLSIPDKVYADAERLATELRISRSDLYSRAIREYVVRHSPDQLTKKMNRVLEKVGNDIDGFIHRAACRALEKVDW
jgi:metal-responsive CopG/Arc/MetJ family transcriptional regulator